MCRNWLCGWEWGCFWNKRTHRHTHTHVYTSLTLKTLLCMHTQAPRHNQRTHAHTHTHTHTHAQIKCAHSHSYLKHIMAAPTRWQTIMCEWFCLFTHMITHTHTRSCTYRTSTRGHHIVCVVGDRTHSYHAWDNTDTFTYTPLCILLSDAYGSRVHPHTHTPSLSTHTPWVHSTRASTRSIWFLIEVMCVCMCVCVSARPVFSVNAQRTAIYEL